ncbi:TolC family protein [Dyella choica]|uniref:Transporter n=1 Tax=Dyella choica TaxID=1927959 RepID=A0A3S0R130_9GAMM|nr:TolC family protein [Dyella choica]RUL70882.1 transporter [Dyella choica]
MVSPNFALRALPACWLGLLTALALFHPLPALAAEPKVADLTLDAATGLAVAQAPLLQARSERWTSAREEAGRAGALPDPQLSVGIDNLAVQGPGAFTAGGDTMTMRSVGFSQVLPSRSLRQAQRTRANADADVAAASVQMTDLAIRQQTAQAWIAAWAAIEEQHMLGMLRDEWTIDLAAAEAHLRGGTGTAADVLAVRTQALDLENRLDDARAREAAARASLARWLGSPVSQPLAAPPDFSQPRKDEQTLLAHLDEQGELLDWPARERAAEAALAEAQAAKHPEWNVSASYGSRTRGLSDMLTLQVGVSLPLFTTNRQDRGISARAADLDAVRAEHDDARRQQTEAVRSAWAQWEATGRQVQRHLQQLLPLADDRAKLALAAYRRGGDLQRLLEARRDELNHHLDYARMLADYGRAWATLAYLLPDGSKP